MMFTVKYTLATLEQKVLMFLISTYNTMAYSSFEKYGKNGSRRNAFKAEIDKVAKKDNRILPWFTIHV